MCNSFTDVRLLQVRHASADPVIQYMQPKYHWKHFCRYGWLCLQTADLVAEEDQLLPADVLNNGTLRLSTS